MISKIIRKPVWCPSNEYKNIYISGIAESFDSSSKLIKIFVATSIKHKADSHTLIITHVYSIDHIKNKAPRLADEEPWNSSKTSFIY